MLGLAAHQLDDDLLSLCYIFVAVSRRRVERRRGARGENTMPSSAPAFGTNTLQRTLCIVVVLVVILATLYAGWIGVANFSRIRV